MPRSSAPSVPARFKALVASFEGKPGVTVEPGWGAGNVVLKAGGKIFAIVGEGRLVVKLPKARVDALVDAGDGDRFDPRNDGRLMKEWLVAGRRLTPAELVTEAHAFVQSAVPSSAQQRKPVE
jgi:hypothetical protein